VEKSESTDKPHRDEVYGWILSDILINSFLSED
jgi:hypothetical protein